MIPGITANDAHKSSSSSYQANAVTFGGTTTLVNSSLTSTDNNFVSFAGWFRPTSSDLSFSVPFVVDPTANGGNYFHVRTNFAIQGTPEQLNFIAAETSGSIQVGYNTGGNPTLIAGAWCHVIGSVEGTGAPPHFFQLYVNNAQVIDLFTTDTNTDVIPLANGLPFWVGNDGQSDPYFGSMADFSFWPGISFLESGGDIPLETRRLFIDASGAPVNPSTAIAALGHPAVMLSGNASTFRLNTLGGSGSFTVTTGGLTNDLTPVHL